METNTNGGTNQNDLALFARYESVGEIVTGYIDEMRYSKVSRYTRGTTFTPNLVSANNATGNYESTAQTANASVNKISAVVTYINASGTATLNTDLILEVSADNGATFTTATLAPIGTFSSGVLQAAANNITVTAGTQIKYKVSFANHATGTKVTQVNGVSLQY
jgi:deoxyxylulose-5-phosphate synthase